MKQTIILPAHLFPAEVTPPIATVEQWEKAIGAAVLAGEPLARLRTGDTSFLVPASTFGVLSKKCVLPGEAIEAGEPLAVLTGVTAPLLDPAPEALLASPIYRATPGENTPALSAQAVTVVDVSEAIRFIGRVERGETVSGKSETLSLLPFVVSAVAASLLRYPLLNTHCISNEPTRSQSINIAVETRDAAGQLWTPALHNTHRSSVLALSREWARLQENIDTGLLAESDITGATFVVSHSPHILYRTPLLHHPLVAHLNFGKAIGKQMHLCLTYDNSLVYEQDAEAFLSDVAEGLASGQFLFTS